MCQCRPSWEVVLSQNYRVDLGQESGRSRSTCRHFYKVLSDPRSSKILTEDKSEFHRVLKELTDAGYRDEKLHTMINQGGVMNAILLGVSQR